MARRAYPFIPVHPQPARRAAQLSGESIRHIRATGGYSGSIMHHAAAAQAHQDAAQRATGVQRTTHLRAMRAHEQEMRQEGRREDTHQRGPISASTRRAMTAGASVDTHGQHNPTPENPAPIQTGKKGGTFHTTKSGHKDYHKR